MNIIQCDEDCIYQREGYCSLEIPTMVTNDTGQGCVHRIQASGKRKPDSVRIATRTISPPPPQMLL
ncbi:hypothetical protein [Clostridium minihomine]|uniref:hypothetical protein n=1 Tax=Clostridium minihomine TaxID=2045012 RepID=UPI00101ADE50|nr:hypothetical protein [Clostridium minihomine]